MNNIYDELKKNFQIIHGPCSIENYEQVYDFLNTFNGSFSYLRGGIYKPRTNPNSFQGLGEKGLEIIKKLREDFKFDFVCEITSIKQLNLISEVNVIQIGARNMQNFELLKAVGKVGKPVLLKRGFGNTVEELIGSAKYLESVGCNQIILCERGIRTFSNVGRFTLDLSAVGYLKDNYDYPVIVDPSHAGGKSTEVIRLAKAAKAYGCDGLLIEVHVDPPNALSDKDQQLNFQEYKDLLDGLKYVNSK